MGISIFCISAHLLFFSNAISASERYGGYVKRLHAWGAFTTCWKSGMKLDKPFKLSIFCDLCLALFISSSSPC